MLGLLHFETWRAYCAEDVGSCHEEVLGRDDAASAVDGVQHVPKEHVQIRDREQTLVVPVPQIMDAIGEVTPRVVELVVDLAVPLILEKILEIIQLVPLERIKNQIVEHNVGVPVPQIKEDGLQLVSTQEQIMDFPVPRILEAVVEVMHSTTQECVQNHTLEQIGDGLHLARQERAQNRTRDQNVDVPVPQFMEAAVENRVPEQIVDSPMPQFMGKTVEIVCSAPQESVQNHTLAQMVDSSVPQFMEAAVEIMPSFPLERVQNRTPEQIMDFPAPPNMVVDEPVPQIAEEIVERPVPPVVLRALQELRRRNLEQNAFEEDEEEEEEDEEEVKISRFPPHFRLRLWCRFLLAGSTCPHGWQCTFAHHESQLHPDSWLVQCGVGWLVFGSRGLASLRPFVGAPAGSPGQVKCTGGTGSGAWHPLTPRECHPVVGSGRCTRWPVIVHVRILRAENWKFRSCIL